MLDDRLFVEGRIWPRAPRFLASWLQRLIDKFDRTAEVCEISDASDSIWDDAHLTVFRTRRRDPNFARSPANGPPNLKVIDGGD